ncbi:hypothetical protein AVEN_240861-1, partial [Araneus ventricosus]
METLVQLRGTYRGCFTKFIEKLEVFLKTEVDDSDLYVCQICTSTEICHHEVHRAFLTDVSLTYNCNFEVLGQEAISTTIPLVADGSWMKELSENNIHLSDQSHGPIELLIGADVAGKLLTGGYKLLPSGLVAIETRLGWTVMGRTRREKGDENTDLIVTSMLTREISETDLWNLDVIGIKDQAEKQSKMEQEEAARQHFLKTLKKLPEGRYEVSLPWLEGLQQPANNRIIAEGRLRRTIKTLQSQNLLRDYEDVFHEWLKEDIIELLNISRLDNLLCTYLPHRAVIKENSTTKIRPVFDASAKQKNGSSLNSCLEKGPNLVELIPSILSRFRLGTFGVIADIKKAFFQISIDDKDRDYLRYLWFENGDPDNLKIYRHEFDYLTNVSSFVKIVRITAWIRRFIRNCRNSKILCSAKYLEVEEMKEAETIIWKMMQKTSFRTVNEERLRNLRPFIDPPGVFRIKTQLLMRKDFENFRYPIVLPSDHIVVQKMIMHKLKTLSNCGVQTLMSILREEFWILKSRRTIRKAIKTCTVCRRFEAKHPEVQAAPLPEDRLRDSATFETTGIDLAGPLYLRDGSKAWVVLNTCAVYRAVHLELVTSLTTDKFLLYLHRFIARRGRPSIIYTDNGSNFKGTNQALNKVDWNKINDD